MKLSPQVKSGVCKALKWHSRADAYYVKVPVLPETKALRDWLFKKRDWAALYFAPGGSLVAIQWNLATADYRGLLKNVPTLEEENGLALAS